MTWTSEWNVNKYQQCLQTPVNTVRVAFISDVHEAQDKIVVPKCDILAVSGDLTYRGAYDKVSDFQVWCHHLFRIGRVDEVVVIAGNHDISAERDPSTFRSLLETENIHYLEDQLITLKGLRIYGSPWTPTFGHGWAFNANRGAAIKRHWDKIPENLDILLTHGPPYGQGDVTAYKMHTENHVGCHDLRAAVLEKKPRVHAFGHIHEGYGVSLLGNTVCLNASSLDLSYKPVNPPLVIDF